VVFIFCCIAYFFISSPFGNNVLWRYLVKAPLPSPPDAVWRRWRKRSSSFSLFSFSAEDSNLISRKFYDGIQDFIAEYTGLHQRQENGCDDVSV
jgi:hypothetical protein